MPDPDETVAVQAALLTIRRTTGLPVAFGGLLADRSQLRIGEVSGAETGALHGLAVTNGNGLGGKALALSRPLAVTDYRVSRTISHEYDAAVAAEDLRAVLAVPVVVRRQVRGVLYGALREPLALGDRTLAAAVEAAGELERTLVAREECRRLLDRFRFVADDPVGPGPAAWEEVREVHGTLRALAPRVADPVLREELLAACGRLAAAGGPATSRAAPACLAPREVDVLACVADGATNAATAGRLGLRPETVKAYLRSAMRKLGAHTRTEAVVAARRAGLLP